MQTYFIQTENVHKMKNCVLEKYINHYFYYLVFRL